MDKKYFVLKALKNSNVMEKKKGSEGFSLSRLQTKQYQLNQRSMMPAVDTEANDKDRQSLRIDYNHRRNLSTDKANAGSDLRIVFPKTMYSRLIRKHSQNKSLSKNTETRKMTPPPDSRSKLAVISTFSKPLEIKPHANSLESPSETLKKDKRAAAAGAVNLPVLKQNASRVPDSPTSNIARQPSVLNTNNESDKEAIFEQYRKLVKSPNIPSDRILNYILLCIRGLHYSINCLKEPSKKFINSRKLSLSEPKQRSTFSSSQEQNSLS